MASTRVLSLFGLLFLFLSLAAAHFSPEQVREDILENLRRAKGGVGRTKGKEVKRSEKRALPPCATPRCVSPGGSCAGPLDVCIGNSDCDDTTNRCVAKLADGATCQPADWFTEDACVNTCLSTGVCNGGRNPGSSCTNDNQCAYSNGTDSYVTSCVQNKCAGVPQNGSCWSDSSSCSPPYVCGEGYLCGSPAALGGRCSSDNGCIGFNVCGSSGFCVAPLGNGDSCNLMRDDCGAPYQCTPSNINGTAATCVQIFTQPAGAFCSDNTQCGEGLMCNIKDFEDFSTCVRPGTPSRARCSDDSACSVGESCSCNYAQGSNQCLPNAPTNPAGVSAALQRAFTCINGCAVPGSRECLTVTCASFQCSYAQLYFSAYVEHYSAFSPSCLLNDLLSTMFSSIDLGFPCDLSTSGNPTSGSNPATGTPGSNTGSGAPGSNTGSATSQQSSSANTLTAYACACAMVAVALLVAM